MEVLTEGPQTEIFASWLQVIWTTLLSTGAQEFPTIRGFTCLSQAHLRIGGGRGWELKADCHRIGWLHLATSRHLLARVYNIDHQSPSHKNRKGKKNVKATFPFISSHHPHTCSALLAPKCTPQTQSHLQFTPFYLAGSLGLYIDVPPTRPFNMILSAHCVFSQNNTKHQV